MRTILRLTAVAVLVVLATGVRAQPPADLVGVYQLEGANPDGTTYNGFVEMSVSGDVWALRWHFPPTGESVGLGMLNGDVLSVIFQTDAGAVGLATFTVNRTDGIVLSGSWLAPGAPMLGRETLTKVTVIPASPAVPDGPRIAV